MNKDTIVASSLGFGLGLVAAILLWIVPRILPKNSLQPTASPTTAQEENTGDVSGATTFEISNPKDGEITEKTTLDLTGNAPGSKTVIVSTSLTQQVLVPESDGSFSLTLTLQTGSNDITVTSINDQSTQEKHVTVYSYDEPI